MLSKVSILFVGLAVMAQAHDVITTKITWTREISRIVYRNCVGCHRDGGTAFPLVKYEEARPWAKAIQEEVLSRRMPPWNAVKGFGEFENDRGLTQEQISTIAAWVEGGAPEGDPAYLPKSPRADAPAVAKITGPRIEVSGTFRLKSPVEVTGIDAGPLPGGASLQVIATLPDGSVDPLIWIQVFNPAFHQPYILKTPLKFPAGTVIQTIPASGSVSLRISSDPGTRKANSASERPSKREIRSVSAHSSVPAGALRN